MLLANPWKYQRRRREPSDDLSYSSFHILTALAIAILIMMMSWYSRSSDAVVFDTPMSETVQSVQKQIENPSDTFVSVDPIR